MGQDIGGALSSGFLNIAHRGARSIAPENTIAAARQAMSAGAHMWELDVRMSRDGHLVVVHDETLDRTSNARSVFPQRKPWRVRDFTLAELKSLDFGSWFGVADPFKQVAKGCISSGEVSKYAGEQIPTLEEALVFTMRHDWLLNVEIKDLSDLPGDEDFPERVAGLVAALDAHGRVIVSSFNHDYLMRVKRVDGRIPVGPLINRPPADPETLMRELGAISCHVAIRALRLSHLQGLTGLGYKVLVWTVNSERTARLLLRQGVAGIFSDFPQRFGKTFKSSEGRGARC